LTLGHSPSHTFSDYLKAATIKEASDVGDAKGTVQVVLDGYKTLLEIERYILDLAGEAGDEGTNALMSDYIREQEKSVWMYSAFLA